MKKLLCLPLALACGFSSASITAATETLFEETNGFLAVEAEQFHSQENSEKRKWHVISDRQFPAEDPAEQNPTRHHALATASGGAYLQILPDTRRSHADPLIHGENFSEIPGEIGVLNYRVRINNPGRYYVWVRAFSTNTEDNGLHAGLNGTWPESGKRLQWCEGKNSWRWESKQRTAAHHCGEPHKIFLDIPTSGLHTISFSMREDGFSFDKFILTHDKSFPGSAP
jgi:hypothetical protein